jgi:mono/diheme cytochrome c family protein
MKTSGGSLEGVMATRLLVPAGVFLMVLCAAGARPAVDETQLPPTYLPSGEQMYKQYCAACHGADAKGHGPVAGVLMTAPPDLTKLAKRHLGKFPYDYVTSILEFGPGPSAHGSSDMPTWGPIFRYYDKQNERAVKERIKRLCDYLASIQEY